jgi:hypothetical protein
VTGHLYTLPSRLAGFADGSFLGSLTDRFEHLAVRREWIWLFTALVIALVPLIPPHGVLDGNEEDYFQLAFRALFPESFGPYDAAFDSSRHRLIIDYPMGLLVWAFGYAATQIVLRVVAITAYAAALSSLFARLRLSVLDALVIIAVFYLLQQQILGRAWLFRTGESKVFAYALVIFAFVAVMDRRPIVAALCLAAATYCHIQVGGFWFCAAMLLMVLDRRRLREVAVTGAVFTVLVAPLVWIVLVDRMTLSALDPPPGMPDADYIYSIIRVPHHVAPFASLDIFVRFWAVNIPVLFLALGAALWVRRRSEVRLHPLATVVVAILCYLVLALVASYFDRHSGIFGKFYLFRPSSLTLLLLLALGLSAINALSPPRLDRFKAVAALLLAVPAFGYALAQAAIVGVTHWRRTATYEALASYVDKTVPPGGIVLIEPSLDLAGVALHRYLPRPTLVANKFVPTNDEEIYRWYGYRQLQDRVFSQGCDRPFELPVRALITRTGPALVRIRDCGPAVEVADGYWVVTVDPTAGSAAGSGS